jgi:hypothetical protein
MLPVPFDAIPVHFCLLKWMESVRAHETARIAPCTSREPLSAVGPKPSVRSRTYREHALLSLQSIHEAHVGGARSNRSADPQNLALSGCWTARGIDAIEQQLESVRVPAKAEAIADGARIEALDTAGAWVLQSCYCACAAKAR